MGAEALFFGGVIGLIGAATRDSGGDDRSGDSPNVQAVNAQNTQQENELKDKIVKQSQEQKQAIDKLEEESKKSQKELEDEKEKLEKKKN